MMMTAAMAFMRFSFRKSPVMRRPCREIRPRPFPAHKPQK